MSHTGLILLIVGIVVVVAAGLILYKMQQTKRLRARFGPEYTRAVQESGSAIRGEARLAKLEKRVERFNIQPLSAAERERFVEAWRGVQANFVDAPQRAVLEADHLVAQVMTVRGYPVSDFDQQAEDLCVNHPLVVENYRAGHEIAVRHSRGRASTEELRQAMIHYRKLFADLAEEPELVRSQAAGR
ncbi:MAG: hypothetical protein ACRD51_04870 [Candidatus Acidiferrum sp.]